MRLLLALLISFLFWGINAFAQSNATCTFDDGREISVRYQSGVSAKQQPSNGQVWAPGDAPMLVFTQSALVVNKVEIPAGAYSMYFLPAKKAWTVIVNKNVTEGSPYSEKDDLVRAPMEITSLSQPADTLTIGLGHTGPKQCSLRFYFGTTAGWTEFDEK